MNIEESKFNQPEQPETSSVETEAVLMSPEEAEQLVEIWNECIRGLRIAIAETLAELKVLRQNSDIEGQELLELESEINELNQELVAQEAFVSESEEALKENKEFLDRKID